MLSKSAHYALRIMAYFAMADGSSPLRAKDLAKEVGIPAAYLSKILRRMVNAGLLTAEKGHGGGFVIAKPATKIKICHVLEAVSEDTTKRSCVFGWDVCSDKNPCILHNRWKQVSGYFEQWAKNTSLADIKNDAGSLEDLDKSLPLRNKIKG